MSSAFSPLGDNSFGVLPVAVRHVDNHLLPPNAAAMEITLDKGCSRVSDVPVPIADLWNPDTCPPAFLPWLAAAFAVTGWDTAKTLKDKRNLIKGAVTDHKLRGTPAGIKRECLKEGVSISITEWFEQTTPGEACTFDVTARMAAPTSEEPYLSPLRFLKVNRAIERANRLAAHYSITAAIDIDTAPETAIAAFASAQINASASFSKHEQSVRSLEVAVAAAGAHSIYAKVTL